MKRFYLVLLLLLAAVWPLVSPAVAQTNWRPFRPGLVYVFRTAKADSIFTLRVDSLSVNGLDSVYHFNRTLRVLRGRGLHYYPTTNNLFGARMQFRPGTGNYTFLLDADVQGGARQWTLQSGIKEGSDYSQPVGPATTTSALSKHLRTVSAGVTDSVLTLRTAPDNDSMVFSRRYGALQLPRSLYGSQYSSRSLYMAELPVPINQSRYYSPTQLFDYQPGDEFGFRADDPSGGLPCFVHHRLRRILSREQLSDSLIYTYLEQTQYKALSVGAPGCGVPVNSITPIEKLRLAISLRTGRSPQYQSLGLMTMEYTRERTPQAPIQVALPPITSPAQDCSQARPVMTSHILYWIPNSPAGPVAYSFLPDFMSVGYGFAPGVGEVFDRLNALVYYRRQTPNGTVTCGLRQDFVTLLPSRPARPAAIASLYPNPAPETATLTLTEPAPSGTCLVLRDALGRQVWQVAVRSGQISVGVPLTAQPAGVYMLQVALPGTTPLTLRLTKE